MLARPKAACPTTTTPARSIVMSFKSKRDPDHPQGLADRFAGETPQQQASHREINQRYRRRKSPRANIRTYGRVKELERLMDDRYGAGAPLPDDDAGRSFVYVVANHLAHGTAPAGR